jgi:hypothetical protein
MNTRNLLFSFLLLTSLFSPSLFAQQFDWAAHGAGPGSEGAFGVAVDDNGNGFITGFYVGPLEIGDTVLTSRGRRDIFIAKYDASGSFQWARTLGGLRDDIAFSMAVDGAGNAYLTGTYEDSIQVGNTTYISAGFEDLIVVKLDGNGVFQWTFSAGGPDADRGLGIDVDAAGNAWVTGFFVGSTQIGDTSFTAFGGFADQDIISLKLDAAGNFEQALHLGGTANDLGKDIIIDGSGNMYCTGSFRGTAQIGDSSFSAVNSDIFLFKYNATGSYDYAVQHPGSGNSDGRKLVVDGQGNAYMAGNFDQSIDVGSTTLTSAGNFDFFVAKYDAAGGVDWVRQSGSPALDNGNGIAVDGTGNVYVSGNVQTNGQVGDSLFLMNCFEALILAAYDANGNFLWALQDTSNPGIDFASSEDLDVTANGTCYLAGIFGGSASVGDSSFTGIGNDAFIVSYTNLPVGIDAAIDRPATRVYPNPFGEELVIDRRENPGEAEMVLLNMMGAAVAVKSLTSNTLHRLNTNDLPAGIYFCTIKSQGRIEQFKLIKP